MSAKLFSQIIKDQPGEGDVHVPAASGKPKKKPGGFMATLKDFLGSSEYASGGEVIDSHFGAVNLLAESVITAQAFAKMTGRAPQPEDMVTVKSDALITNAPWTSKVVAADGFRLKVAFDDGDCWYDFDPENIESISDDPERTLWTFAKAAQSDSQADPEPKAEKPKDGEPNTRHLRPLDEARSHFPLPHDPNALAQLREDQKPRFYGALTDSDKLPTKTFKLTDLVGTQNRVDTAKVQSMAAAKDTGDKKPVVVTMHGRNYIADGHHRVAAQWLKGEDSIEAAHKDITEPSNEMKAGQEAVQIIVPITKTDAAQRLCFGWASVAKIGDETVEDCQGSQIDIEDLEKAFYGFTEEHRNAGEMHGDFGQQYGSLVECMMFTPEKEALGIVAKDEKGESIYGAWIGFRASPEIWAKVVDKTYSSFSFGGFAVREPID